MQKIIIIYNEDQRLRGSYVLQFYQPTVFTVYKLKYVINFHDFETT